MPQTISDKITTDKPDKLCLTGNEAIVRGALEAGVGFVSGYPGTPASEIGDIFRTIARDRGISYEDSINEKVAVETAFTASLLGVRSLAAMKHLGLAYAGDPVGTIPYMGTSGGFVIVSGGDPGLIVSPNEQDQRYTARMVHMPAFDPASPQQALEMCRFGFELSEQTKLPVLLRTTIQLNFARGVVEPGSLPAELPKKPYEKSPENHVPIPINARRMRSTLAERIERAESLLNQSAFFPRYGSGKIGIVTSGVSLNYVLDAVEELGCGQLVQVLHLGCVYPIPRDVITSLFESTESILVVEELLPFVEETLRASAQKIGFDGPIYGKSSGHTSELFALDPDIVRECVRDVVVGKTLAKPAMPAEPAAEKAPEVTPPPPSNELLAARPPVLCAGCAHRSTFMAVKLVLGKEALSCNDIGCYTLGYGSPLDSADMLLCMGSSITMASTASRLGHKNAVAYIGDSTFFHSGLPALANAVRNDDNIIVVVMDNRTVAMTGHQSSFAAESETGDKEMSIENVSRALGAKVWVNDPDDLGDVVPLVADIARDSGVRVLVSRKDCVLAKARTVVKKGKAFRVDPALCRHCGHEGKSLYCGQPVSLEHQRAMALSRVLSLAASNKTAGGGAAESPTLPEDAPATISTHDGAPCALACPVNICIQGYIGRTSTGNFAEALEQVRLRNPLPVVSSFVCHRPCESACVFASTGEPVAINRIKEFLITWEKDQHASETHGDEIKKQQPSAETSSAEPEAASKKVAIVGAGPAGLACAADLVDRGHTPVVFDAHEKPGGMLEQAIPPYRLPRDMLAWEIEAIKNKGVEFVGGWKLSKDNTIDGLLKGDYEAVCLALGAHKPKGLSRLKVVDSDGQPAERPVTNGVPIAYALDFLKDVCAGRLKELERTVVVVGGGDCAVDAARASLRLGAASVTILYRRGFDDMPARREEIDEALEEGARIVGRSQIAEVCANGNVIKKITAQKTQPGEPDDSGRRRPVPVSGAFFEIEADVILLATGEDPEGTDVLGLAGINVQPDGVIVVDPARGETSRRGVYAAGDAAGAPRTVVDAIASGKRAAFGIDVFLSGGEYKAEPLEFLDAYEGSAGQSRAEALDLETPRHGYKEKEYSTPGGSYTSIERKSGRRPNDFNRTIPALDEAQARELAARCLLCGSCGECSACLDLFGCPAMHVQDGKVSIDEALCTGCGVCALFCPNAAIVEVPET